MTWLPLPLAAFAAGIVSFLSPCVLPLVPGYVSMISTRFAKPAESYMPCHEYCGTGHEAMWARVRIIDKSAFLELAKQQRRVSCVAQ